MSGNGMNGIVNVGEVLAGKYRVDKVLGIGGMGMVVAATHLELDQRVALKFMLPEAMRSEQAVERFLREAKAAVKLRGEHVCRVLDVGKLEYGAPYIVMELMEGQDFADVIKKFGPLSVEDTVDYVLQALEGLAEAHANQIVHRDLKPGNLFVATDSDGSPLVKVLDFGISKSSIAGSATRTGDVMGSPAYMSPEQMASSKNVDARADLWAIGVILYQAVTGELPFDGDTLPALCMSVMNAQPAPIATVRKDLPPGFAMVIMRCLEKTPELRYRDVAELAAALAPFGPATATAAATRIAKVLRRTAATPIASASGVAPTMMSTAESLVAPTQHGTSPPVRAASSPGRISTLQGSAAEISIAPPAPPRKRTGLVIGILGATVVAGVLAVVMLRGGGKPEVAAGTAPAAAAAPTAVEAAPAAAAPVPAPVEPASTASVPPPPAVATEPAASVPTTPELPAPAPAVTSAKHPSTSRKPGRKPPPVTAPAITKVAPVEAKPVTAPTTPPVTTTPAPTPPPTTTPPASKWTHMQHDKGT